MTTTSQYEKKLRDSLRIFETIGIKPPGFRPPGWGIDSQFNLIRVLKDMNIFQYVAASSLDAGLNAKQPKVDSYMPDWYDDILNMPQNLELDLPLPDLLKQIELLIHDSKLISVKGHFCNIDWVANSFNRQSFEKLLTMIAHLKNYRIWFATFAEVATYFKSSTRAQVNIEQSPSAMLFVIRLPEKIRGLTVSIITDDLMQSTAPLLIKNSTEAIVNSSIHSTLIFDYLANEYRLKIQ